MRGSREQKPACVKKSTWVAEVDGRRVRVQETVWMGAAGKRLVAELHDYDDPRQCAVVDGWNEAQFRGTLETAIRSFVASLSQRKIGN